MVNDFLKEVEAGTQCCLISGDTAVVRKPFQEAEDMGPQSLKESGDFLTHPLSAP